MEANAKLHAPTVLSLRKETLVANGIVLCESKIWYVFCCEQKKITPADSGHGVCFCFVCVICYYLMRYFGCNLLNLFSM
jgi:hypothetical protein